MIAQETYIGHSIERFGVVNSTMDLARDYLDKEDAHGKIILADAQTKGRGRQWKHWQANPGSALLFTIILKHADFRGLHTFAVWPGIALCQVLAEFGIETDRIRMKWPNDVLIDGKKLSGILVERTTEYVLIGMGINISQTQREFERQQLPDACSLQMLNPSCPIDTLNIRETLLQKLLPHLEECWELWKNRTGNSTDPLLSLWKKYAPCTGKEVLMKTHLHSTRGTLLSWNWDEARIRHIQGIVQAFPTMEIQSIELV